MNKGYMGIDLGTSSVKILIVHENGEIQKSRMSYQSISPDGWYDAICRAALELDTSECVAVGLSSQVGTYIINGNNIISWNDGCGSEEIREIKSAYSSDKFIEEISMPHPEIISYPIPRLMYIQKKYGNGVSVCQPKDMIIQRLTGNMVTDKYSWRGLTNVRTNSYSKFFVEKAGNPKLPKVTDPCEKAGTVSEEACAKTGIPVGTPVYTGLNDFYASIAGMGIMAVGEMFDITGTSEHLGVITDKLCHNTPLVASPYIENNVHYGVTASSGASIKYAINCFGSCDFEADEELVRNAPVFLPYLNGERAPIFDADARGMFFGINGNCNNKHMVYSVLEGVVFSLYHIHENLGRPSAREITVSGGAADISALNFLKAELFGADIRILAESDTSALGGAMTAAIGFGAYRDFADAAKNMCETKALVHPGGHLRELMLKRFEIYKELYPETKDINNRFKEVQQ